MSAPRRAHRHPFFAGPAPYCPWARVGALIDTTLFLERGWRVKAVALLQLNMPVGALRRASTLPFLGTVGAAPLRTYEPKHTTFKPLTSSCRRTRLELAWRGPGAARALMHLRLVPSVPRVHCTPCSVYAVYSSYSAESEKRGNALVGERTNVDREADQRTGRSPTNSIGHEVKSHAQILGWSPTPRVGSGMVGAGT